MNSGIIRIENNTIFWDFKEENIAIVDIESVKLIGEYTIQTLDDDWYIVFVFNDCSWKRISMYADNIKYLLDFLSENVHIDLNKTQLANSTQFLSIVSYPDILRGKNLFDLIKKEIKLSQDVINFIVYENTII